METKVRLWPAWALIIIAAVLVATVPFLLTRTMWHFYGLIGGPILAMFGILAWWLIASRVKGIWRWLPVVIFLAGMAAVWVAIYPDRKLIPMYYLAPPIAAAWVLWLTLSRPVNRSVQLAGALSVILLGWAAAGFLVRIDGTDAEMVPELRWAWVPSAEESFAKELAERRKLAASLGVSPTVEIQTGDWPGFRGPNRDAHCKSSMIRTDWKANPPRELWRQRVGAGWGSFAVVGDRLFTQEQRGNDEAVVCYHAQTGTELWEARVPARFMEDISGAGPRATPTVHDGKVFAFGATGKLIALDAATGKQLWLKDVCVDVGATPPQWGFASSPLVIAGNVLVFSAVKDKAVVAYRVSDGALAWTNGWGTHGYSSPHRLKIADLVEPQGFREIVLMVSDFGIEAFEAETGGYHGHHAWTLKGQNRVAQPTVLEDNSVLLGTPVGSEQGARKLRLAHIGMGVNFEVQWTSRSPRPYFNDGVAFNGHYYGWDDRNFVCVDLKNGKVKWNAGSGYGFGQVLLLPSKGLLLIQAENGTVHLLEANSEEQIEIAKLAALKDKTWNHPVIVRGKLYVRNGVEAACYDISEVGK